MRAAAQEGARARTADIEVSARWQMLGYTATLLWNKHTGVFTAVLGDHSPTISASGYSKTEAMRGLVELMTLPHQEPP